MLDEFLQSVERGLPLMRDGRQVTPGFFEPRRLQFPNAFAAARCAANETRVRKHLQVLGNCLPGDRAVRCQFGNGSRSTLGKPRE